MEYVLIKRLAIVSLFVGLTACGGGAGRRGIVTQGCACERKLLTLLCKQLARCTGQACVEAAHARASSTTEPDDPPCTVSGN